MQSLIEQADCDVTLLTRLGERRRLRNLSTVRVGRRNRQLAGELKRKKNSYAGAGYGGHSHDGHHPRMREILE